MRHTLHIESKKPVYVLLNGIPYSYAPYWYNVTARPLYFDMILPKHREDIKPLPLIIWICGGAFQQQDRSLWLPTMMYYVYEGYAVAGIDYRVSSQAPYPAAVVDVKAAIRFLRAHSKEFCLDPNRFVVMGESAGGYLASMAGVADTRYEVGEYLNVSSQVQAIVDFYGKVDLNKMGTDYSCDQQITGFIAGLSPEEVKGASPIVLLDKDAPPFLIFHSQDDLLVPIAESEALYEKLVKEGVETEFYTMQGEGHGSDAFYQPEVQKIITDFLGRVLQ